MLVERGIGIVVANKMCPHYLLISFIWLWEAARDTVERNFMFHRIMQMAVTLKIVLP